MMHTPQREPGHLRLVFSIDSSKVTAAAYEPASADRKARLHGFATRQAGLVGPTGPQSLRLASDAIIELTENVESQTGEHFSEATVSFASPGLVFGGSSLRLPLGEGPISPKELDQLAKLWTTGPSPREGFHTFFRLRSRYLVDRVSWTSDPEGLRAEWIAQSEVHFSEKRSFLLNMVEAFRICGLRIRRVVPQPCANLLACTSLHERQQGIMVIDVGHKLCQIITCRDHLVRGVAIYPVGSERITEDLSICLKVDPTAAEQIKRNTLLSPSGRDPEIPSLAADIISARVREIVAHLRQLSHSRFSKRDYVAGIVLCGGGAKLSGLSAEIRSRIHPIARVVHGYGLEGLSDVLDEPGMASIAGSILADGEGQPGVVHDLPTSKTDGRQGRFGRWSKRLKTVFSASK